MNYAGVQVNTKYSSIVAPNLYADAIFQPGVTYSDEYQGDGVGAGAVKIPMVGSSDVVEPKVPTTDFSHVDAKNELVDVLLNNAFMKSEKIYQVQSDAVPYNMAETHLARATQNCRGGWQASGLACLVHEGTVLDDTAAITKSNIKANVMETRKSIRKAFAQANVVLASVDTYTAMLQAAGDQYTPNTNEMVVQSGQVGRWMGMLWVECNMLDLLSAAKYYDYAGVLQTEDLTKIDYIMYDWRGFSIIDNLEAIRLIDSSSFVGTLAQVAINSGYRVPQKARVAIKKHA